MLPADWLTEETEQGGVFYPAGSASRPTLRLTVLSFSGPKQMAQKDLETAVAMRGEGRSAEVTPSPRGYPMAHFAAEVMEEGDRFSLYHWKFGQALPPATVRLVVFTLDLPLPTEQSDEDRRLLKLLDVQLRQCKLADVNGVVVK